MTHSSNWNYTTLKQRGGYDERSKTICDRSDLKVMSMHKELSVKSRVRGDFHARFCERVRVKLPRSTRPCTALRILIDSLGNTLQSQLHFRTSVINKQIRASTKLTQDQGKNSISQHQESAFKKRLHIFALDS